MYMAAAGAGSQAALGGLRCREFAVARMNRCRCRTADQRPVLAGTNRTVPAGPSWVPEHKLAFVDIHKTDCRSQEGPSRLHVVGERAAAAGSNIAYHTCCEAAYSRGRSGGSGSGCNGGSVAATLRSYSTNRVSSRVNLARICSNVDAVGFNCKPSHAYSTLHVDIVHADDTKPLIGSSRLPLRDVVGLARRADRTLHLTRPSGRPQGKLDVAVSVREPGYRAPPPPAAREYPYVGPYGGAPAYAAPPSGYPAYRAPPPSYGYGQDSFYGGPQQGYVEEEEKKGSKFGGMGTGLAVGAVAGVLGGIALTEGVDALEDHIADDVADDLADEEEDY
ncbi:hypothetical protein SASPL_126692 [Salvia splendens]|uniref:Uncharacterized protein n=1 Tax=Salvia splendens TaxID=180675 RepID=A0A8X8XHG9_SALSN|nr:hypothetical protein SASPL_126692 [Salvia splendens]